MASAVGQAQLSPAEFLAWERAQPERHEYFRGEVFAMAAGSLRHNALCSTVNAALHGALTGKGCHVFSSDQRIGASAGERYVYADITVVCGPVVLDLGTKDVLANPGIIVEVLSKSTEPYDRGLKWEGYQRISSLSDYVLVSQTEPRAEHFRRELDGVWTYRSAGAGDRVTLASGAVLDVDSVFAGAFEISGE